MLTCSWVTVWQRGQRTECFLNRALLIVRARHQKILKPWGLVDNTERMCAGPTFYDTPPGTIPKIRLPVTVVCLDSVFSLEFPSVERFSTFYSSWFIPTDWSVRAEGENIMLYSNHYDSFKRRTPRLHCRCIPCLHPSPSPDWSDICRRSILMPFVARHQPTRQLILSDQNLSISAWPPFHSSPQRLCPTVSSPFTGLIRWVLP